MFATYTRLHLQRTVKSAKVNSEAQAKSWLLTATKIQYQGTKWLNSATEAILEHLILYWHPAWAEIQVHKV